jgi:hypothetical protein
MLDGPRPNTDIDSSPSGGLGRDTSLVLIALLALVAIQTFFPLLYVGSITNDDLKLGNAALDRGLRGVASVLWAFTRRDGRLDITQMLSWYPPFAVDSFLYFKAVSFAAIVADLLLFALFVRSVLRSQKAFFLALLLCLVGLQNSWEHSPLTAFPGLFTFTFAYLLGSFLAFQWYLDRGGRRGLISAVLFFLTICQYEMYLIYTPVFFGLALLAGRSTRQALRAMVPHLAATVVHLALWSTSHSFRIGNYPGVTVAHGLDLHRIAHVVWQFSVSSLPTYFFFNAKYQFLLRSYRKDVGFYGLYTALSAGPLMKAALVGALYAFLMATPERSPSPLGIRARWAMLGAAVFYFFAPSFLPSLTERYQEEVKQQLGMQASYFSLFAWIFLLLPLLLSASQMQRRRPVRWLLIGVTGSALMFASLAVDYTNSAVGEWQAQGRDRFKIVDAFLRTPDYAQIPEGAVIYAPSLWRSSALNATLSSFMGTAIDPRPSMEPKYENFWTFYFTYRGRKPVIVTDRLERVPPRTEFFYLRHAQFRDIRDQYLVFAGVRPTTPSAATLVSDWAFVYDNTRWPSAMVGGSVIEKGAVLLRGGPSRTTSDRFVFRVGTHYDPMGYLQRCAVETDTPIIDVESVFLAGSAPPEPRAVFKANGWLLDGWIGAEATAIAYVREDSRLIVDAYAPDYIFKQTGTEAVTVTVELDHAVVATRRLTQGGRFRMEANVDTDARGEIMIRCGPLHSPQAAGLGSDRRKLCVIIDRVTLRTRERGE